MSAIAAAVSSTAAGRGGLWGLSVAVAAPVVEVGFARPRQATVTLATFAVLSVLIAGGPR